MSAVRVLSAVVAVGVLASAACEGVDDTSEREWEVVRPTVAWGRVGDATVLLFSWHEGQEAPSGSLYIVREDGTGLAALRPPTSDSYDISPLVSRMGHGSPTPQRWTAERYDTMNSSRWTLTALTTCG